MAMTTGTVREWLAKRSVTAFSYGSFRSQKAQKQIAALAKAHGATLQPQLEELLEPPLDYTVSATAAEVLATLGAPALKPLMTALQASLARADSTEEILLRRACVSALADLGPLASPARSQLTPLLAANDFGLRQSAVVALLSLETETDTAAAVASALADHSSVRSVLSLLAYKPVAAAQAAPLIAAAIPTMMPGEIEMMLQVAVAAGPAGKPIAEAALTNTLPRIRKRAEEALAAIAPRKRAAPARKPAASKRKPGTKRR